jgi:hypothetical protein
MHLSTSATLTTLRRRDVFVVVLVTLFAVAASLQGTNAIKPIFY